MPRKLKIKKASDKKIEMMFEAKRPKLMGPNGGRDLKGFDKKTAFGG